MVFVEGENGQRDLRGLGIGINVKQFQHWCDQDIFVPPVERSKEKTTVLFVGRPIKEKGMHIIKAAEKMLNDPKYEFIYAQDVSYKNLPKLYQVAHVVVVPSLYAEGYSRVVIEAASCGCSVITSDQGSLPEMIQSFGYATEATPEKFAMMIGLHKDPDGLRCLKHALENFNSKNAEVFLNEYNN